MADAMVQTIDDALPILVKFAGYQERHFYECVKLTGKYCKHCDESGMFG